MIGNWMIILFLIVVFGIGSFVTYIRLQKKIDELSIKNKSQRAIISTEGLWLKKKIKGREIDFLRENPQSKAVAVYGIGNLGKNLIEELLEQNVEVNYIIDKKAESIKSFLDIPIYTPDADLPETDLVIITAVYYYDDIAFKLKKKVSCPIVSLEEVIRYEES